MMERRLPPQYAGWQDHEPELRRLSTPELIEEVQDGAPERRLAALSVIDLADVPGEIIRDWIRSLPDPEVNELAGAIPAQRLHGTCKDDYRWLDLARTGYELRRLPTFLVMLFSSLEALDSRRCPEAHGAWEEVAAWLDATCDALLEDGDLEALGDISLFVFENHLRRRPVLEAFCRLIRKHRLLAMQVSKSPAQLLLDLPKPQQRLILSVAAESGGLPLQQSWRALHDLV